MKNLHRAATQELEEARRRSDELRLNILPSPIAKPPEAGEGMIADRFGDVTVPFAHIAGTLMSA